MTAPDIDTFSLLTHHTYGRVAYGLLRDQGPTTPLGIALALKDGYGHTITSENGGRVEHAEITIPDDIIKPEDKDRRSPVTKQEITDMFAHFGLTAEVRERDIPIRGQQSNQYIHITLDNDPAKLETCQKLAASLKQFDAFLWELRQIGNFEPNVRLSRDNMYIFLGFRGEEQEGIAPESNTSFKEEERRIRDVFASIGIKTRCTVPAFRNERIDKVAILRQFLNDDQPVEPSSSRDDEYYAGINTTDKASYNRLNAICRKISRYEQSFSDAGFAAFK